MSSQALAFNLQQLTETFNAHRQFLKEAHAYPLTSFPGHTQEGLLGQLLRKKLEPGVEDWIEEYTTKGVDGQQRVNGAPSEGLSRNELRELWNSAAPTSQGIVGPMLEEDGEFGDDFTIAEREEGVENVITGLRRKLDGESDDEDDEDGDEKMEDVIPSAKVAAEEEGGVDTSLPPLPLDSVLRFMTTGARPPG